MRELGHPPYDLIVRGVLVTATGQVPNGWLAILDGKILALGQGAHPRGREIRDYGQSWIMPGAIDGQVHAGSWAGLAGLEFTSKSAVAGGVTTIVDMPYDEPDPVTSPALIDAKAEAIARYAHCDVALYATLAKGQDADDVIGLAAAGACAIKLSAFESHPVRFPRIAADQVLDILEAAAGTGLPVGLHNEDQEIVRARMAQCKAAGHTTAEWHSRSRPPAAELAATAQFLELGAAAGAHAHIVHISLPRGFQLVDQYRDAGFTATAEMCVHYLVFDEAVDGPRLGAQMKVNPPIRPDVKDALWRELLDGRVEFVSSDHSGWPLARKTTASFFDAAAGIPGLETLVPAFYSGLAQRSSRAVEDCALYLSERPARFFGLWPRKGALDVGSDADIMVLESRTWIYDSRAAHDEVSWSPFDGQEFSARVAATYVRGSLAWDGAQIRTAAGHGRFVPRRPTIARTEESIKRPPMELRDRQGTGASAEAVLTPHGG